jgi:hypothetical protein
LPPSAAGALAVAGDVSPWPDDRAAAALAVARALGDGAARGTWCAGGAAVPGAAGCVDGGLCGGFVAARAVAADRWQLTSDPRKGEVAEGRAREARAYNEEYRMAMMLRASYHGEAE